MGKAWNIFSDEGHAESEVWPGAGRVCKDREGGKVDGRPILENRHMVSMTFQA